MFIYDTYLLYNFRATGTKDSCAFTKTHIEDAYGPEVSLFLHCHLRGYDKNGEGKYQDHGMIIITCVQ